MTRKSIFVLAASLAVTDASAADQPAAHEFPKAVDLPAVAAVLPPTGPRIWTFVKGGTTLRVLGTLQPLPRDLRFDMVGIHEALQASDAVLTEQGVVTGEGIGLFSGLALLPSMRKLKRNASGRTLGDVLSHADYREWENLSSLYLPDKTRVEVMRPMYAAGELYEAAVTRNRLDRHHPAKASLAALTKKLGMPLIDGRLHIHIANPKKAVAAYHVDGDDDLSCFREVMRSLPSWLDAARQAGVEWASGSYRAIPLAPRRCWSWLTNRAIASSQDIALEQAVRKRWMQSLNTAVRTHANIFTRMPYADLEHRTGLASALLKEGYIDVSTESIREDDE